MALKTVTTLLVLLATSEHSWCQLSSGQMPEGAQMSGGQMSTGGIVLDTDFQVTDPKEDESINAIGE